MSRFNVEKKLLHPFLKQVALIANSLPDSVDVTCKEKIFDVVVGHEVNKLAKFLEESLEQVFIEDEKFEHPKTLLDTKINENGCIIDKLKNQHGYDRQPETDWEKAHAICIEDPEGKMTYWVPGSDTISIRSRARGRNLITSTGLSPVFKGRSSERIKPVGKDESLQKKIDALVDDLVSTVPKKKAVKKKKTSKETVKKKKTSKEVKKKND